MSILLSPLQQPDHNTQDQDYLVLLVIVNSDRQEEPYHFREVLPSNSQKNNRLLRSENCSYSSLYILITIINLLT